MESTKKLKRVWSEHAARRDFVLPKISEIKKLNDPIIKNLLKLKKNKKILDAGCGIGQYVSVARALGFKASGLDISEEAVSIARKRKEKAILGDMRKMPFRSNSYEIVIAGGSLEHFPETSKAVEEISRVLKPQGILLGNVPYRYALLYSLSRKIQQILGIWKAGYEKTFSKSEFSRILSDNGLHLEMIQLTKIAKGKRKILSSLLRILDWPLYVLGLGGAHFYFLARKK